MNSHPGLLSSLPASRPSFAFSPMRIDPVSDEQRDQDQLHHQVWLITNLFRPLRSTLYLQVQHTRQNIKLGLHLCPLSYAQVYEGP